MTYRSSATNLVADDTNGVMDAFVHDRLTGATSRVSVSSTGVEGNAPTDDPAISATGRYVVFRSQASNFVANDTNGTKWDIFVKDTQTGAIDRVSVSSAGDQANGASADPVISADGRYVVFRSSANNLVSGDTNGQQDLFLRDRTEGTTIRISNGTGGAQSNGLADDPAISDDGARIAFHADATNLVTGDTNGVRDVFVYERSTGVISRVSVDAAGVQANGGSEDASISGDGARVAFESDATNLVASDTNAKQDVFVRTIASGTIERVSVTNGGAQASSGSGEPSLSADGSRIAFYSTASNLVTGDTNSRGDIFVRDTTVGTTVRKSIGASGAQADDASKNPSISGSGTAVAFQSVATNLVEGDTNGLADVFVRGAGFDSATYGYDRLYRLTQASGPGSDTTYTYDPLGNRLTRDRAGTTTTYAYDRADRLTAAGASAVSVDATGATTARGSDSFAYDQANRLVSATVADTTETYAYDGDGTRFSRTVGAGSPIRAVSDPTLGLPLTIDEGSRKHVWGAAGLAYTVDGTTLEVVHPDRLGSIRAVTDGAGTVTATFRTDEFGLPTSSTGAAGTPFRYTGEPLDASGLGYLRARYYDPSIGRFMSRDTWPGRGTQSQSLNRYIYVANNPATWTDPSGHCLQFLVGGLVAALPTGGTSLVAGTAATVGCGIVLGVVTVAAGAAAWVAGSAAGEALAVIDQRDGKSIPVINPPVFVPGPAPAPPPQRPEGEDPFNIPPGWPVFVGLGVIISLIGNLFFGVDGDGNPIMERVPSPPSKSQILRPMNEPSAP